MTDKQQIKELQARNDRQAEEITRLWGLAKGNDRLTGEVERLKEAIIRGRELYEDNEPRQMFLVWEQALKDK